MGQEFFINSQELEDKIKSLLPSQGGAGAGFDLSASTQIIPIVDLTESAEGSNVRADLQTALSHSSVTTFRVSNTTTNLVVNTGYYRVFGSANFLSDASATRSGKFTLNDGSTDKDIIEYSAIDGSTDSVPLILSYDFVVFLPAGHSLICTSSTNAIMEGCTRQIADVNGALTNP